MLYWIYYVIPYSWWNIYFHHALFIESRFFNWLWILWKWSAVNWSCMIKQFLCFECDRSGKLHDLSQSLSILDWNLWTIIVVRCDVRVTSINFLISCSKLLIFFKGRTSIFEQRPFNDRSYWKFGFHAFSSFGGHKHWLSWGKGQIAFSPFWALPQAQ